MITHIFFDFFGVIVPAWMDSEIGIWAKKFGVSYDKMKEIIYPYWDTINQWKISTKTFWKNIAQDLWIKIDEDPNKLFSDTIKWVNVFPEILQLVRQLKRNGYKCVVLSDVFEPDKEYVAKHGWYDDFDDLILSCEVGLSKFEDVYKHTHKIFDFALDKHGIDGNQAIFIDDREHNCKAANSAGIKTILAENPQAIIDWINNILTLELN